MSVMMMVELGFISVFLLSFCSVVSYLLCPSSDSRPQIFNIAFHFGRAKHIIPFEDCHQHLLEPSQRNDAFARAQG